MKIATDVLFSTFSSFANIEFNFIGTQMDGSENTKI
jgi:hypothetical protein